MTCVSLLDRRRADEFSSSLPSLDAMLFHLSVAKGRSLHGKPGMRVIRLLMSSANSASTDQQWMTMTLKPWKSLWS